jgi:hypothetical protein
VLLARSARFKPAALAAVLATVTAVALAACGSIPAPASPTPGSAATGQTQIQTPVSPHPTAVMDARHFWSIIASTRSSRSTSERAELLEGKLTSLPPQQVAEFDRQLTLAVNTISEPRHLGAAEIMMGFTSKEAFDAFRAWVVAQGEDVHADFRDDPDSLVDAGLNREGELVAGEMVSFAPERAYHQLTGRSLVEDYPGRPVRVSLGTSPDGPTYEELARELPRLADAYLPSPPPEGNAFQDGPRGIERRP